MTIVAVGGKGRNKAVPNVECAHKKEKKERGNNKKRIITTAT